MNRLIVTGAEGLIGRIIRRSLIEYDVIAFDQAVPDTSASIQTDLQDAERLAEQFGRFTPCDHLLHLAADSNVGANWESVLRNNIVATQSVFEAARACQIRRIVFASSNHVTGLYEGQPPSLHRSRQPSLIDTTMPMRPDSLYAVSKVFGEALARYYVETHGLEVVCLRLGSIVKTDDPLVDPRYRSTWLSHRDLSTLIAVSLESKVRFGVYYGVSANSRRFWDISNACRDLGYKPQDNAERLYAQHESESSAG